MDSWRKRVKLKWSEQAKERSDSEFSKEGIAMGEVKNCPKCGGEMDKADWDMLGGVHLVTKGRRITIGDKVFPYSCRKCGNVELYREMKGVKP